MHAESGSFVDHLHVPRQLQHLLLSAASAQPVIHVVISLYGIHSSRVSPLELRRMSVLHVLRQRWGTSGTEGEHAHLVVHQGLLLVVAPHEPL